MSFKAACPFCSKKMKVSSKKLGASIPCQQCGNHFTAVPPDEVASGPSTYRQLATRTANSTDGAQRGPALGDSARPVDVPVLSDLLLSSATAIPGWINLWGFAGFFLTGCAFFLATTSLMRPLAISLAGVGLLICIAGIMFTSRKKPKDVAWLGIGATLATAFLIIAFVVPGAINRFWGMDSAVPTTDPSKQFLASWNNQVTGKELDAADWVEADRFAVRQGDIHVRIESVKIELDTAKEHPTPKDLVITLRISNVGQLHRYAYRSPTGASERPVLTDNRGRKYELRNASAESGAPRFLKPLANLHTQWSTVPLEPGVENLDLEFPASAWGGKGWCRFRMSKSMIAFPPKE